jgi:hypothetical protein
MAERPPDDAQARQRTEEARAAQQVVSGLQIEHQRLREPTWGWYLAGFVALGISYVALQFMHPPPHGVEPELLAPIREAVLKTPPTSEPAPAALDLSVSMWRNALELSAPRLPSDRYTAVLLIDGSDQRWLVQQGNRPDGSCLPDCGKLKLRVEVYPLTPGPFHVAVLVSAKPIPQAQLAAWLPHAIDQVPRGLGLRAFAVAKVKR